VPTGLGGPAGEGGFALCLCRWETPAELPVSLPPDASPEEAALLRRALRAWEGVGLGLRFSQVPPGAERIAIRFAAEDPEAAARTSALTGADCRLGRPPVLSHASIELRRTNTNVIGKPVPLDPEELFGAALHELGHALGFQGHPASGVSVVSRDRDVVRRIARRVLDGGRLDDPTLRALYRLPPGVAVGRVAAGDVARAVWRALAARARTGGWDGPFVRVGDRSARLFWRDAGGGEVGIDVPRWGPVRRGERELVLLPDAAAWRALRE
jgi:hypothetical protein